MGEAGARNGESIAEDLPPWLNPFQLVAWVRYRDASIAEEADTHTNLAAKVFFPTADQIGSADQALEALRSGRLRSYGAERGCKMTEIEAVEWTRIDLAPLNPERQHPYESIRFRCEDVVAAFPPLESEEASHNEQIGSLPASANTIELPLPKKLQPVAPPPASFRLPPEQTFVSLSHALTWIAFGVSMGSDQLHKALSEERYGEHDSQEAIKAAVPQLLDRARDERVALQGKHRKSHRHEKRILLTAPIDPLRLADFRQFNYLSDELRHGEGLTWWRTAPGVTDRLVSGGRSDSFIEVSVKRGDLLREFPPKVEPSAQEHFRYGHTFKRDDPAVIAPWWTVNQSLAWIATRQADFVEWIGSRERDRNDGALLTHFAFAQDVVSVQAESLVEHSWPGASVLAQAGRLLLGKIEAEEVKPRVRGSVVAIEAFVGIGLDQTGADWLDIDPRPLFSSAEVTKAFPTPAKAGERSGSAKGGRPPEHDWDAMKRLAEAALRQHPKLTRSKLADSLVSEYAAKVSPSPPVKRTIERKLGEWGMGGTKPLRS